MNSAYYTHYKKLTSNPNVIYVDSSVLPYKGTSSQIIYNFGVRDPTTYKYLKHLYITYDKSNSTASMICDFYPPTQNDFSIALKTPELYTQIIKEFNEYVNEPNNKEHLKKYNHATILRHLMYMGILNKILEK